jgi:maltose O-acetyltransferase
MGLELGDCAIAPRVFFGSRNIRVGDNVFLNQGVLLDGAGRIDLGDGVQLGLGVTIVTGSHEIGARNQRAGADRADSVSIGPGVWIGARAVILPGVNIGAGAIIGAGAVVTQDCLVDGVYVGVPARRARTLPPGPDGQG